MTRKGRLPIPIPSGVEIKVDTGTIIVKGGKGELKQELMEGIQIHIEANKIIVSLDESAQEHRNFHGLYRSLIHNMVEGVSKGFDRKLEMNGVGYRAAVQGKHLNLQVGYSHPTQLLIPEGLTVTVDKGTLIVVSGIDKQKIGQFAAVIRSMRPPEPYQGKGIRYQNEFVRKKAGKTAAKK